MMKFCSLEDSPDYLLINTNSMHNLWFKDIVSLAGISSVLTLFSSQELYRWPSVAAISRTVLGIRYSLLPYYYTLFYKAHRDVDPQNAPSGTVTRPLFFAFPKDPNTYGIDRQFMVGSALLISPVLELG